MGSSTWLSYLALSALTGNPLLALGLVVGAAWLLDRSTVGFFPRTWRALVRLRRVGVLRRLLSVNPHDRRARLELADLLVGQGRHTAALDVLKPNLEAGDDDPDTLFVMGVACLGAGHAEQGELLLTDVQEQSPRFKQGAVDLERGRFRLRRGDAAGAQEALERFCQLRQGSVEGKVLLARALSALGQGGQARALRQAAWKDFRAAPAFRRREERLWAWQARPAVPLLWAGVGLAVAGVAGLGLPPVVARARAALGPAVASLGDPGDEEDDVAFTTQTLRLPWRVVPAHPAVDAGRFERVAPLPPGQVPQSVNRYALYGPHQPGPALLPGDMACRLWALYGPPDAEGREGLRYSLRDKESGRPFVVEGQVAFVLYAMAEADQQLLRPALLALEQLALSTPPRPCQLEYDGPSGGRRRMGVEGEVAFDGPL